jgi:DNA-binding transcriptional regulator GbsR (MarR family)
MRVTRATRRSDTQTRRTGGRAAKALELFIEEMGRFYESNGMPRIGARIMGLLLCAPRPLTAEQISDRLGAARSSVSTNVRLLMARGAAEEVTYTGDRLTYYRFSWATWEQVLRRQIAGMGRAKEITGRALASIGARHPARPRIEEYEQWVDFFTQRYQAMLDEWPSRKEK